MVNQESTLPFVLYTKSHVYFQLHVYDLILQALTNRRGWFLRRKFARSK